MDSSPPPPDPSALAEWRAGHGRSLDRIAEADQETWTLVLDDDPTGTQTVRNVPVVMHPWHLEDLDRAADRRSTDGRPHRITFALTNSRAMDEVEAAAVNRHLVRQAADLADRRRLRLRVISRSDSTLRGHFGAELTAAQQALEDAGSPVDGIVFAPCFLEAGRYTIDDTQWIRRDGALVPAAHTEFANDATFGYDELDLLDWTRARIGHNRVESLALADLRSGRVHGTAERLSALRRGRVLVVNAATPGDLEVLMLAVQRAENQGRHLLFRTGPSFVRLCAAQAESTPLDRGRDLTPPEVPRHGLLVVGSHTRLTNRQVEAASSTHPLAVVELSVRALLRPATAGAEIRRCVLAVTAALGQTDVLIQTTRQVLSAPPDALAVGRAVSAALVKVVADVLANTSLRFLIAKGGITSSDIATQALGVTTAEVIGQVFAGQLSIWRLLDGRAPTLPYVIFPGNVGEATSLASTLSLLTQRG